MITQGERLALSSKEFFHGDLVREFVCRLDLGNKKGVDGIFELRAEPINNNMLAG